MPHSEGPLHISEFPNPILHVDCDAFFTSVEQALNPELRGRPVVTGRERGIVACASYEAKALGVRRPMRLFEAKKVCPSLVCLPSDYETYSLYSKRLFAILRRFTPAVEEYSVDEAFAELSGLRRLFHTGFPEIARRVKDDVQKELGITVSVGLSASKTLAKLASQYSKPDGFTVVPANELQNFLPRIPVPKVCGFGPNTTALLEKNGVRTAWDYVRRPREWAGRLLGKIGIELWQELRGEAVYGLTTEEKHDYASISKCKTFTPPSPDKNFVRAQLVRNVESAFIKLRRHNLRAGGLCVYLRDKDFKSSGLEARLDRPTSSTLEAVPMASELFEKIYTSEKPYRLTGVVLFRLTATREVQYSLFEDSAKIRSFSAIDEVIDRVNGLYGKHTLHLGTGAWLGEHRQHVAERGDRPFRKGLCLPGENQRQRLGLPFWNVAV